MKTTNVHGLPDVFAKAASAFEGDYTRGKSDFTATELLRPARLHALLKEHWDEITEDVSERVWSLPGQVGHLIFERIAKDDPERYVAEQRMYADVDGKIIGAKMDLYDRKELTLWDYKYTSVWKFIMGDTLEWERQLNVNRFCAIQNRLGVRSISPKKLRVLCLLKDWKPRDAVKKADSGYPQLAVHIVDLPIWSEEKTKAYIRERIAALIGAEADLVMGMDPPMCTPDERWSTPEKWAVMKRGRKSAVKLHDDEVTANKHAAIEGGYVEHRPGESRRCQHYCPVATFCEFGRRILGLDPDGNTGSTPT